MLLSVIIPVYNAENGLRECVDSILSQIDNSDEIILVNDGSKDRSGEICDEYKNKYHNVKVIHQQNKGALLTRRAGMYAAEGEYFIFPDADDYLVKGAIVKIKSAIVSYHPDIICYDWNRIDALTGDKSVIKQLPWIDTTETNLVDLAQLREGIGRTNTTGVLTAKVINRNMIDWDADYEQYGNRICVSNDLFQCLPILDKAKTAVYIPKPLYCYKKTVGSITLSYKPEKINSYIKVLERREFYLKKWTIDEKLKNMSRCRTMGAITLMLEAAYKKCRVEENRIEGVFDIVSNSNTLKRCYETVRKENPELLTKKIKLIFANVLNRKYVLAKAFLWMEKMR